MGFGWGFGHGLMGVFVNIVGAFLWIICASVLIGVLFLLVRFLLVGTRAAQLYVAKHEPPRPVAPAAPPAAPAAASGPDAVPTTAASAAAPTARSAPAAKPASAAKPVTRSTPAVKPPTRPAPNVPRTPKKPSAS
jgi:predicted lipid-binding transport protein (Tim44 family)